jgi:CO dehydrogenase/acetyl-CoA synthase alpha subunit
MGVNMMRICGLIAGLVFLATGAAQANTLPPGPMHDTVTKACAQCHSADVVSSERKTRAGWADTVNQMVANGAQVSDADFDKVVDYLAKNFGAK